MLRLHVQDRGVGFGSEARERALRCRLIVAPSRLRAIGEQPVHVAAVLDEDGVALQGPVVGGGSERRRSSGQSIDVAACERAGLNPLR